MNGRTHMTFGALSFAVLAGPVAHTTGVPDIPLIGVAGGLCVGAVSGLLPDIDEPNALLGRGGWMPRKLGPLARLLGVIVSLPFRIAGFFIKGVLGHRGGTHSFAMSVVFTLCFAIPLTLVFGSGADWVIWAIWCGFISHLLADSMNPSGVPWLWPLFSKHKTFHILPKPFRIPTETPPVKREQLVNILVGAAAVFLLGFYFILLPFLG